MDGHKQSDIVTYQNDVFLPAMARFETQMAHYNGPQLTRSEPKLAEEEREIIPCFHDESTFYAYEEVRSAWLQKGEQPLRKKFKKWHYPMAVKKVCSRFLKSGVSRFQNCVPSVLQFVQLRMKIVVWLIFSVSRTTSRINHRCWKIMLHHAATCAFFFLNSIVN